ncbi:hypothetical protein SASPL_142842 [Salvia splendens]|uniref:Uncharacterized protein n=1 Tax=Salvia splendens TaxID=180675 RepID=A0A8X8Z964_SALSN|nr:hypothetical protein SASPL_142842 [Salvia splendens]
MPAAVVPLYRGGPLEGVVVLDEAVVVEEVQDKSCSEVMLFNSNDHTSVTIELVGSVEFEHLGGGNDRIEVNGENKDRDRVDEKESLVLAEEERCDERERVHSTDSIFETEAKEALVHDVPT